MRVAYLGVGCAFQDAYAPYNAWSTQRDWVRFVSYAGLQINTHDNDATSLDLTLGSLLVDEAQKLHGLVMSGH